MKRLVLLTGIISFAGHHVIAGMPSIKQISDSMVSGIKSVTSKASSTTVSTKQVTTQKRYAKSSRSNS
jgi:hypothetical protein